MPTQEKQSCRHLGLHGMIVRASLLKNRLYCRSESNISERRQSQAGLPAQPSPKAAVRPGKAQGTRSCLGLIRCSQMVPMVGKADCAWLEH